MPRRHDHDPMFRIFLGIALTGGIAGEYNTFKLCASKEGVHRVFFHVTDGRLERGFSSGGFCVVDGVAPLPQVL